MRRLLDPLGILIGQTIPAVLLFIALYDVYQVVHPLLDAKTLAHWHRLAWMLGALIAGSAGMALWYKLRGRPVDAVAAGAGFVAFTALLYAYAVDSSALYPWDIPRWMVPPDAELYPFRFLAMPLAYALFVLVLHSLPAGHRGRPVRDLLIAAAIPLVVYLFVQVVEPWRIGIDFERHVWVVLFITLVTAFLFFLFRAALAMVRRREGKAGIWRAVFHVLVALVFPVLGLLTHQGHIGPFGGNGPFGDLGHPGFYWIAVLNALVVLWPSSADHRVRLLQFILRSIGFSYVLYFFFLFLPFLPLSIVAILAFGLGFLMLAPVLLFLVQGAQLLDDLRHLSAHRSRLQLGGVFLLALAILPGAITLHYYQHRSTLHRALAYVYHPDLSQAAPEHVDTDKLATVLDRIDAQQRGWRGMGGEHTPFLTAWYDRIVLDNLTLGRSKAKTLRAVFLGKVLEPEHATPRWGEPDHDVALTGSRVESRYDAQAEAWRSWVHLDMHYAREGQGEYVTEFHLPSGAYIADQYLMIEGRREPGILAERKAATWVYQQIVRERQDPSLMRYVAPQQVELRVFPFAADEQRQAGFEVLHPDPLVLVVDGDSLQLGHAGTALLTTAIASNDGLLAYLPAGLTAQLPRVRRSPHVHFVVDGGTSSEAERRTMLQRIDELLDREAIDPANATLHITNASVLSLPYAEGRAGYPGHYGPGGFFSDRAVRRILRDACLRPTAQRPIIVVAAMGNAPHYLNAGILLDDLGELGFCLPEGPLFHVLDANGALHTRHFSAPHAALPPQGLNTDAEVLAWPDAAAPRAHLPDTPGGAVVYQEKEGGADRSDLATRHWPDALRLEGRWRRSLLFPEGGTTEWRRLVRGSFEAQVLTPVTAWMCLENEAQRNALLKKQEEVLSGQAALDAGNDDLTRMSEPPLWWLLLLVLPWLWYRSRRPA
jgi:hypothetical protein